MLSFLSNYNVEVGAENASEALFNKVLQSIADKVRNIYLLNLCLQGDFSCSIFSIIWIPLLCGCTCALFMVVLVLGQPLGPVLIDTTCEEFKIIEKVL